MNQRIEHCLYQAGLTAQGCWDELDDYARQGIEKFAELIVRECGRVYIQNQQDGVMTLTEDLLYHLGIKK